MRLCSSHLLFFFATPPSFFMLARLSSVGQIGCSVHQNGYLLVQPVLHIPSGGGTRPTLYIQR